METLKNKCDAIWWEVNGKVFSFKRSHTDHTVYSSGVCKTDLGDYKQDVTVDPSIWFPPSSILPHLVVSWESNPLIFKNSCKWYQWSLDSTTELLTCEINDRFFAVLPPHEHYPSPDWQCLDDYSIQKSKMLESCSNID